MLQLLTDAGLRFRLMISRVLLRLGFGDQAFLVPLAVLIGIVSAGAAVAFHELIHLIRDLLYVKMMSPAPPLRSRDLRSWFCSRPPAGWRSVCSAPTSCGAREGHGIIDVMETVLRSRGHIRPLLAVEKILTAAATIGTGGSAGAEGPIVQIGAAICSGIGQLFQINPSQLPILIGCGTAAGISAIFSSPMGGVLFTLEVILLDFSVRAFTPIVSASVVAYVTTQAIFHWIDPGGSHYAIFSVPPGAISIGPQPARLAGRPQHGPSRAGLRRGRRRPDPPHVPLGGTLHRLPVRRAIRPALGGRAVGVTGRRSTSSSSAGCCSAGPSRSPSINIPMPAFFGDGYGVVQQLIGTRLYDRSTIDMRHLVVLLLFLFASKGRRDLPDPLQRRQRRDHRAEPLPGRHSGRPCWE